MSKVEIRAVLHYCYLRKMDIGETELEMDSVYGALAPSHSTVKKWFARFKSGYEGLDDLPRSGRPKNLELPKKIKKFLEKQPFASARHIAESLGEAKTTVLEIIHGDLGFIWRKLKWVPHLLTKEIKQLRVEKSKEMLVILTKNFKYQWHSIISGDECWFYWYNPHTHMWADPTVDLPQIEKKIISSKKTMVSVFFCAHGIMLVEALPPELKFNSAYMVDRILPKIEMKAKELKPKMGSKGMWIHMDNARCHISGVTSQKIDEIQMKRMPQPPYSPDISPCDFWLFGATKEYLKGNYFQSESELLNAINQFFNNLTKTDFLNVYREWIDRLKTVIETHGEYIIN